MEIICGKANDKITAIANGNYSKTGTKSLTFADSKNETLGLLAICVNALGEGYSGF